MAVISRSTQYGVWPGCRPPFLAWEVHKKLQIIEKRFFYKIVSREVLFSALSLSLGMMEAIIVDISYLYQIMHFPDQVCAQFWYSFGAVPCRGL